MKVSFQIAIFIEILLLLGLMFLSFLYFSSGHHIPFQTKIKLIISTLIILLLLVFTIIKYRNIN